MWGIPTKVHDAAKIITVCFEYIWTVLNTREQSLSFYYKENKNSAKRLIGKKEYKIREKVKNRVSVKKFV